MSMTGVAVLCLLVVGVWGQCCPPDVYEITMDVVYGRAEITREMERVSYDGESKRIYIHAINYINNIVSEVIMDYKNGKEYLWGNGYCQVLPVGNFSKSCIPETAKLLSQSYMGAAPHELSVKMYSFEKDSYEGFATVTAECTPIEDYFSNVAKGYIQFAVYSNFSTGIKDPSVFTPPEICHKGMSSAHIAGRRKRRFTLF
ncbi:mammalian ependymin-related protein 1-like [Crassostrea angulata]|uniref:mammalian ependymin-related protein 1-like n=1 Tax=Magallana angulata TaxID=2784310 RepID=UPI0022B12BFE|nr:mammalian ependymin-related protein 1-like [Crassostrea angulata]